ncbi:MAG: diguanylate cyclase [bacterium]|nr:diguanylate cyclase [bacterium]
MLLTLDIFLYIAGYLFAAFLSFSMTAFILAKNFKPNINKWFVLLHFCLACWWLGSAFIKISAFPYDFAINFYRLTYLFAFLIPALGIHFIFSLLKKEWGGYFRDIFYIITFILISFLPSSFFIQGLVSTNDNVFQEIYIGVFYYIFIVTFLLSCGYALYVFMKKRKKASSLKKGQFNIILSGYSLIYLGGVLFFCDILKILNVFALSGYVGSCGLLIIAYGIMKHKLMEVEVVWRYFFEYFCYIIIGVILFFIFTVYLFLNTSLLTAFLITSFVATVFMPFFRVGFFKVSHNFMLLSYQSLWNKLEKISQKRNNNLDIRDFAEFLVKDLVMTMKLEKGVYYKLNELNNKYIPLLATKPQYYLPLDQTIIAYLKKTQNYIYRDDLEALEIKKVMQDINISLCFPIFYDNLMVGIIVYGEKKTENTFHHQELRFLREITKKVQEQLTNTLYLQYSLNHNAEDIVRKYKHTYQMYILREIKHMGAIKQLDDLYTHAVDLIKRAMSCSFKALYCFDERQNSYIKKYVINVDDEFPEKISEQNYLVENLRIKKEIIVYDNLKKIETSRGVKEDIFPHFNSLLIVPLTDITLFGFLVIEDQKENKEFYTSDDFILLSMIADRLELTISNLLTREKAERDPLTNLYNKDYFLRRTNEEIASSLKYSKPLAMLMIDIDDFKYFNHYFGHTIGDEVLKAVSNAVNLVLRPMDEFCRYGGEELGILALDTNENQAVILTQKIIEGIKANKKLSDIFNVYSKRVSVSIGLSFFYNGIEETEFLNEDILEASNQLFNRANLALIRAQNRGVFNYTLSAAFKKGDKLVEKTLFPLRILILSETSGYTEFDIPNMVIETVFTFEEVLDIYAGYDIVILEMPEEDLTIFSNMEKLMAENKDCKLAVVTEYTEYKKVINELGVKFFVTPFYPEDLKNWVQTLGSLTPGKDSQTYDLTQGLRLQSDTTKKIILK